MLVYMGKKGIRKFRGVSFWRADYLLCISQNMRSTVHGPLCPAYSPTYCGTGQFWPAWYFQMRRSGNISHFAAGNVSYFAAGNVSHLAIKKEQMIILEIET